MTASKLTRTSTRAGPGKDCSPIAQGAVLAFKVKLRDSKPSGSFVAVWKLPEERLLFIFVHEDPQTPTYDFETLSNYRPPNNSGTSPWLMALDFLKRRYDVGI